MNNLPFEIICFRVPHCVNFTDTIAEAAKNIAGQSYIGKLVKLSVFAAAIDNREFANTRKLALSLLSDNFPGVALGFVAQAPDDSHSISFEAWFLKTDNYELKTLQMADFAALTVRGKDFSCLITSNVFAPIDCHGIKEQSDYVFDIIHCFLEMEEMGFGHIVRQWNYIEDITTHCKGSQHYQIFNDVRSHWYSTNSFPMGYPAATGIGVNAGGVSVEAIAIKGEMNILSVTNPLQIDAHHYSSEVLDENMLEMAIRKSTPKFERAKVAGAGYGVRLFVSGTASIKGQETIGNTVEEQTQMTIENIHLLIENARKLTLNPNLSVTAFRVYVKFPNDLTSVKQICNNAYPGIRGLYVIADICRDNLLVEIEAFAKPVNF